MVDKLPKEKVRAALEARLNVNLLLADVYSFIRSIEETSYLAQIPMDQLIAQAINQLGAPPEVKLSGNMDPVTDPPVGSMSRRASILLLQGRFGKQQIEQLKSLPDISDSAFDAALLASFEGKASRPMEEKAGG